MNKRKNNDLLPGFFEDIRAVKIIKMRIEKMTIEITLPVLSSNPENIRF